MKTLVQYIKESKDGKILYNDIFNKLYKYLLKSNKENKKGYSDKEIDDYFHQDLNSDSFKENENKVVEELFEEYPDMDWSTKSQLIEYIKRNDNALCAKELIGTALYQAFVKFVYIHIQHIKYEGHV